MSQISTTRRWLMHARASRARSERYSDVWWTSIILRPICRTRALFRIGGPAAREVLAKLPSVNHSPAAFQPGALRRSRAAQVVISFSLRDDGDFALLCFRSVARYAVDLSKLPAEEGAEVGLFPV